MMQSTEGTYSQPQKHQCICTAYDDSTWTSYEGSREDEQIRNKQSWRSPFFILFVILNIILILLGSALAAVSFYTMTLDEPTDDYMTFAFQYHLENLMFATGLGGILAALTGLVGLVVVYPRVGSSRVSSEARVIYEIMLLASGALLLVCGVLALGAILLRRVIIDRHFRPQMLRYREETPPNPFLELHLFQASYRCCGLSKPPDPYAHLHETRFGPLPWSCCVNYTSEIRKNITLVRELITTVRKSTCTHNETEFHSQYCDQINHRLSDWAFYIGIAALLLSLYCIMLLAISCIARHDVFSKYEDSDYDEHQ